tara:strand:- start:106 stop:516 length:411 start_codon:yes stop_codon:yes gene_type:complete
MAHYAFLNENNIVTEVITGKEENTENTDWEVFYGDFRKQVCKRTSYNTKANVHRLGKTPFRGNFAFPGSTYDEAKDAFIAPQPYPSWLLNETTHAWEAPVAEPNPNPDADGKFYDWHEETRSWKNFVFDEATQKWI